MSKYTQLQQKYDELSEKYEKLFAEKSEIEYSYNRLKEDSERRNSEDEEIRMLHQNARRLKHDMKNHFMVLSSYLSSEDYEAAKQYSSEILDKLNAMNSYVETGNSLMNHIVNEKFQRARVQSIQIKAEIENLSFKCMKSIDFSALLTNMLDNAIEASVREKKEEREINLIVSSKKGYDVVCVKNRISKSVLENNPNLESIKEDAMSHGIGIPRMKEIVENYNGMFDIYEAEGFFCLSAFIPK